MFNRILNFYKGTNLFSSSRDYLKGTRTRKNAEYQPDNIARWSQPMTEIHVALHAQFLLGVFSANFFGKSRWHDDEPRESEARARAVSAIIGPGIADVADTRQEHGDQ